MPKVSEVIRSSQLSVSSGVNRFDFQLASDRLTSSSGRLFPSGKTSKTTNKKGALGTVACTGPLMSDEGASSIFHQVPCER